MIYLAIALYIVTVVMGIIAAMMYFDGRACKKFGNLQTAKVMSVEASGGGLKKIYKGSLTYKIDKKKYKALVKGKFYQPMIKNKEVAIRYNVLNPNEVVLECSDDYKPVTVVALGCMFVANIITMF